MSRGFVKEGDQEEPVVIPPRAALPKSVTNYVTPAGLKLLQQERETLVRQLSEVESTNERELRRTRTLLNGKLQLLNERLASARVLHPSQQPKDVVRFGATVTYVMPPAQQTLTLTIVGVDEADIQQRKIAFVAPLVQAVTGAKKGQTVQFQLGNETRNLLIKEISYTEE